MTARRSRFWRALYALVSADGHQRRSSLMSKAGGCEVFVEGVVIVGSILLAFGIQA